MSMEKDNANEDVIADEEQEPNDQLSNQDALLLVFVILCAARLLLFMATSIWKLLRQVAGLKDSDLVEESNEVIRAEMSAKQTAVIRLCHLQFLVLAEKLKQELSGSHAASGDEEVVGQMIASLPASQLNKENVRLSDILQILEQIPLKEHGLSNVTIEEQMAAIHDDLEENDLDIVGAWTRLQALYSSFQAIQVAIRKRAKQRAQRPQSVAETARERSYTEDVLGELSKVTHTLPQGFTADMFASLGHAIQQQQQEQTSMSRRIARYPSNVSDTEQKKND
ncbi:hypothetical protein FI667_g4870, partial [Globisporangium splendens]